MDPPAPVGAQVVKPMRTQPIRWVITGIGAGLLIASPAWATLVRAVPGRVVFVDTSSASFPFLQRLAARDRIVVTSTDSTAQQFETIFPEFFIKAFEGQEADLDKNGRVSIWEAFEFASR